MNLEDYFLILLIVMIATLCTGAWFVGQDTMASEVCRDAGYASGIYDKPVIICHGEVEIYIPTIDKETP